LDTQPREKAAGPLAFASVPRQVAEFLRDIGDGNVASGCGGAGDQLDLPFRRFFADGDAVRDADQVRIFKFYPCALVAVVEENIETGGFEIDGDFFAGGVEGRVAEALVMVTTTSKGAMERGNQKPLASLPCSMAAVRMRSMPMP
jgi:hypothetical protein